VTADRVAEIRSRLIEVFNPESLDIVDESHLHIGHAGAKEGKGHFRVRIIAAQFANRTPLQRHRMVYDALGDLMKTEIHALSVSAMSSDANDAQNINQNRRD
jgi:BolA protein